MHSRSSHAQVLPDTEIGAKRVFQRAADAQRLHTPRAYRPPMDADSDEGGTLDLVEELTFQDA